MNFSYLSAILIIVFISMVTVFALLYKYTKTERIAIEAKNNERALLALNKTLDKMSRMKTEFFQNMSHDFKTPLTVVSTCLLNIEDMLNFGILNEDEIRESITGAQKEIMRISRMIDSTMKLSARGENQHDLSLVDIAATLREGAEAYRVFYKHNGIALAVGIPETLPLIRGNADMLMHVMSNILSNANRHTKSGGASLFATYENDNIVIKLSDTGDGIPPDMLPVIFERGVTTGGTGLGLSICKTVVEEIHGGKIFIESILGEGTKVTILLPVHSEGGE